MLNGELQLVINTPSGKGARTDEGRIRAAAVSHGVPCITTLQAAEAAVQAMEAHAGRGTDGAGRAGSVPAVCTIAPGGHQCAEPGVRCGRGGTP